MLSRWAVVLTVMGALVLVAPGAAGQVGDEADRLTDDVAAAQEQLQALRDEEAIAVEAANRATDDLRRVSGRAIAARRQADAALEELSAARRALTARAVAAYKSGGGLLGQAALLLDSRSPTEFLERLRYLRELSTRDRQRLERVRQGQQRTASLETAAQTDVEAQIAAAGRRDSELARASRAVADQRSVLQRLSAQQLAAVQAEEARRLAAVAATGAWNGPMPVVRVPHEGLQRVIDTALAQLGTPYVWGGEWPGGFDCSGLTRYAYAQVGIDILHRADWQYLYGSHPGRNELQPGDIVFFSKTGQAEDIHHNGMYIGDGLMVVAPFTGATVRIESINRADYFGASRLISI